MFTLEITQSAETDLDKITDYLGFELSNPKAALALLDEIDRVSARSAIRKRMCRCARSPQGFGQQAR